MTVLPLPIPEKPGNLFLADAPASTNPETLNNTIFQQLVRPVPANGQNVP
jgi:hypothetical protein